MGCGGAGVKRVVSWMSDRTLSPGLAGGDETPRGRLVAPMTCLGVRSGFSRTAVDSCVVVFFFSLRRSGG